MPGLGPGARRPPTGDSSRPKAGTRARPVAGRRHGRPEVRPARAGGATPPAGRDPGDVYRSPSLPGGKSHSDFSAAYPGLMTSLIIASRSSKGMNADFIAFTVNHWNSSQP